MSIAGSISKFLHRTRTDAASTEEELKKVVEAVRPEVSSLKTQVISAVGLDLAHVSTDVKNALEVLSYDHKADIAGVVTTMETSFADIFKRFDDIKDQLEALRADTASKTASARKTVAKTAAAATAAATAAPAAKAVAAPVKDAPGK
jgi:hypothetical protein